MEKIAIIYTTFLRDELMKKTIQSICDNWNDNYVLLIGNQNKETTEIESWLWKQYYSLPDYYDTPKGKIKVLNHYKLPYDCGLSYARNYLVDKANEMGIKYCILSADSIEFTDKYDFTSCIKVLEGRRDLSIIGLGLKDRQAWEKKLTLKSDGFHISNAKDMIIREHIDFKVCDVVKNFFIAKTIALYNIKWDDELKLCEHEDFFWRLKQAHHSVYFTDSIEAQYHPDKPQTYAVMRNRLYSTFSKILKKKYNITSFGGWIKYDD